MIRTAGTIPLGSDAKETDAKETFFQKHVNIFFKRIFFVSEQFLVLYRYLFSYLLIFVFTYFRSQQQITYLYYSQNSRANMVLMNDNKEVENKQEVIADV